MTIRLLLADDQAMVRQGFGALLNAQQDMAVVGEATNGEGAVRTCRELRPDVVLMDVRMLAEQTVKTHVGRILTKLDLRDRAQVVVTAYESGRASCRERVCLLV